jgi:SNF2 family DNA or RNA helicase
VEEKMLELQEKKKALQSLYEGGVNLSQLTAEEILSLFGK